MKKYSLPHLFGNQRLKMAVSGFSGGTGSSIILDGPVGCGKRTAAFDLAMGLLCKDPHEVPCGTCDSCTRMKAGTHPDYHVLAFDGKAVKVEEVRALRTKTFIRSSEGEFKVVLIEQGDKLSPQAQNTLLKVLEEPHNTRFIILCDNREALLQTVRSRCVTFRVEPLTQGELRTALAGYDFHSKDIERAVTAAEGSLGQALTFLSGEELVWRQLVRVFGDALDRDEAALYALCIELGKLSREDYASFCDGARHRLLEKTKMNPCHQYITIFEYIGEQKTLIPANPSPVAMAGALVAFCAGTIK